MYINNLGHMTKMAAMPIYGKNPSKIIFSETNRLISRKLGVRHRWLKYSNVYINHDPVMTLTKFMARSTWVACASELGKLLKCHLKENRKLANGQNIEDSEKRKWPKGLSAPALELNTIIFKHVYWYMQLISGERLQDHWSSGLLLPCKTTWLKFCFWLTAIFLPVNESAETSYLWLRLSYDGDLSLSNKMLYLLSGFLSRIFNCFYLSRLVGKPTMWFSNRSDTNRAVQSQKQARSLRFWS